MSEKLVKESLRNTLHGLLIRLEEWIASFSELSLGYIGMGLVDSLKFGLFGINTIDLELKRFIGGIAKMSAIPAYWGKFITYWSIPNLSIERPATLVTCRSMDEMTLSGASSRSAMRSLTDCTESALLSKIQKTCQKRMLTLAISSIAYSISFNCLSRSSQIWNQETHG